jgi:hypothetical protein
MRYRREPLVDRADRAHLGCGAVRHPEHRALTVLVGLGTPDGHAQPVGTPFEVAELERRQLAASGRQREAEQQRARVPLPRVGGAVERHHDPREGRQVERPDPPRRLRVVAAQPRHDPPDRLVRVGESNPAAPWNAEIADSLVWMVDGLMLWLRY